MLNYAKKSLNQFVWTHTINEYCNLAVDEWLSLLTEK
jgi:hypothetical protein